MSYKYTTLKESIHPPDVNPIYGETVIHLSIDDEEAGPFIILSQDGQKLRLDLQELELIICRARVLVGRYPEGEK